MSYAVEAWFGTYKNHTDKIFILQKKASAHFKQLEILKVCDLYKYQMITLMLKELNIIADLLPDFNFSVNNHSHDTRANVMLNIPLCRLFKSKFAVTVSSPKLYDSIPLDICNLSSLNPFLRNKFLLKPLVLRAHYVRGFTWNVAYVMVILIN